MAGCANDARQFGVTAEAGGPGVAGEGSPGLDSGRSASGGSPEDRTDRDGAAGELAAAGAFGQGGEDSSTGGPSVQGSAGDAAVGSEDPAGEVPAPGGGTGAGGGSGTGGQDGSGGASGSVLGTGGGSADGSGGTSGGALGIGGDLATGGAPSGGQGGAAGTGGTPTGGQGGAAGTGGTPTGGQGGAAGTGGTPTGGQTATGGGGTGGTGSTITVEPSSLDEAKLGVPYSAQITASGGTTYQWSLLSGKLPRGLSVGGLDQATVALSGTAREAGIFAFELQVTDGLGSTSVSLSLTVTQRVAFIADRSTLGVPELYMAAVGGSNVGAPVKVNPVLSSGGVADFAWSPDGDQIAYVAKTESGSPQRLWVASASQPGEATAVSPDDEPVSQFAWMKDAAHLLFVSRGSNGYDNLYVVNAAPPLAGTAQQAGFSMLPGSWTREVLEIQPVPDSRGALVLFSLLGLGTPAHEAYYVGRDGDGWSSPAALDVTSSPVAWIAGASPDGTLVSLVREDLEDLRVFEAGANLPNLEISDGTNHVAVWSPSARSLLHAASEGESEDGVLWRRTFRSTGEWTEWELFRQSGAVITDVGPWSPEGEHGLFACGDAHELHAVSDVETATSSDVELVHPADFLENGFTAIADYGWSEDSGWIALQADRYADGREELFLVRWSELGTVQRPHAQAQGSGVQAWQFSPDSTKLALVGFIDRAMADLYVVDLPPSGLPEAAKRISAASDPDVLPDMQWLAGSRVLLHLVGDIAGPQLRAAQITGVSPSTTVSVSGSSGSGVTLYAVAPTP